MTTLLISPLDEERIAALRRMKMLATGLLVLMAVIFVIAWLLQDDYPWLGYVRAAAEAGMVGALADWFAVTALFRRPLGLPIPHTAIIPSKKDMIGSALSQFVAENFLNENVVRGKLSRLAVSSRLGGWLAADGAGRVTQELAAAVHGVANVLDDDDIGELIAATIRRRVATSRWVHPSAGSWPTWWSAATTTIWSTWRVERLYEWVLRNQHVISGAVRNQAPSWSPPFVDALVSDKLFREVEKFVRGVRDNPHHRIRAALDDFLADVARDLQHDPEMIARADLVKQRIFDNPQVQTLAASAWTSVKESVLEAADDPGSPLRLRATAGLADFGRRLVDDQELAGKIDGWLADAAGYAARRYAGEVAGIIDETVANWDGEATSRKLELLVGRDLQFIRINGTVVGALAGLVIYALAHNLLG